MGRKDAKMIQYDTMAKKLLASPPILAFILKHCTDEFRDIPVELIEKKCLGETMIGSDNAREEPVVRSLPTEDKTEGEMSVLYDIKAVARVPNAEKDIQIIVNIEAQKEVPRSYPLLKRAIYYCSRLISAQMVKGSKRVDYRHIHKVYSIWVLMNSSRKRSNSIVRYGLSETPERGDFRATRDSYDLISVVILSLGDKETAGGGILGMLDTVFRSSKSDLEMAEELKDKYDLDIVDYMSEEEVDMCNLSEGFVDKGRREGLQQGRSEQARFTNTQLKSLGMDISQRSKVLGLSEQQLRKWESEAES